MRRRENVGIMRPPAIPAITPTRQILIFSRLFSIKNHAIRLYFGECSICFHCYHDFLVSK